jgi:putative nucleotidyltransferase with HDIG domain
MLKLTVERAIEHYESIRSRHELEQVNERLTLRLQDMTRSFVRTVADTLEARDEHIFGHARRVSGYATAVGRRLRLNVEMLETLSLGALLHDIGMIGTPDSILLKPTALDDEERAALELHAERGARMLAGVPDMEEVASAVRHHHEHWDGTGYPEGLSGEMIPLASRIIHVADAYDAMTSPRSFRDACDHEAAAAQLLSQAGKLFDPEVVRAFCGLEELAKIRGNISRGVFGEGLANAPYMIGEVGFDDLLSDVEDEPVLAASVLRHANEIAGDEPVTSIKGACELLGEERLRSLVMQNCERQRCRLDPEQFWQHSLRCAMAARMLAERTGLIDPEVAYTLGLLHDVGELLLRSLFPEEMENILWFTDESRLDREVAAFGVDHAQVGQWVLDATGLPRALTTAVQMHHDAARVNAPLALLLNIADSLAIAKDSTEVAALDSLGTDRLYALKLSRADVAKIHGQMERLLEEKLAVVC